MWIDLLVLVVSLPVQSLNGEQPEEHLWRLLPSWGCCWYSSSTASLTVVSTPLALCAKFGNGTCEMPSSHSRISPEWKWDVWGSLARCAGKCAAAFQAVLINLHWWRAWGFGIHHLLLVCHCLLLVKLIFRQLVLGTEANIFCTWLALSGMLKCFAT